MHTESTVIYVLMAQGMKQTGTIGAPGLVNEPIMNDGLITYPDTSGAGFVIDFHYPTLTIGNYMANIALIN